MGKTPAGRKAAARPEKHPHVRGEDSYRFYPDRGGLETPPRAWGRPTVRPMPQNMKRNTPTCVGKTRYRIEARYTSEKHPHVRGEDPSKKGQGGGLTETPPRAWGRRLPQPAGGACPRNTPTCVGKTSGRDRHKASNWETPPRAWGRRLVDAFHRHALGNTPTCVGKTPDVQVEP